MSSDIAFRFSVLTSPDAYTGAANVNSSLLALSVIAVLLPAAFVLAINSGTTALSSEGTAVLKMSRGVGVQHVNHETPLT